MTRACPCGLLWFYKQYTTTTGYCLVSFSSKGKHSKGNNGHIEIWFFV